jgi:hypothetical protein
LIPELVNVSVAHFLLGLVEAELFLEEVLFVQNLFGLGKMSAEFQNSLKVFKN